MTIHLVVPNAMFERTWGARPFTMAITAAICVPPAMMTGMLSAAPATTPAAAGIIGSPTACTAFNGSAFICSLLNGELEMPSWTIFSLRE